MLPADRLLQAPRRRFAAARQYTVRRWLPVVLLAVVIALATAVRLHRIGEHSLWLDEAYTYQRAAMEPAQGIEASIKKSHVPTYFLFMHYWLAVGDSESALRMPSAIFGVLTVLAAFVLGRVLAGDGVGLFTALLVSLSPLQVRYAQEARMYTMITFAATIAITGVVWLLKHPEQAGMPLWRSPAWRDGTELRARRRSWLAYVLGTIAVLYLHNTAVFFVVTCSLCALVLIAVARGRRWVVIGNWTLANLVVLAAWSFWIETLLRQTKKVAGEFWPDFPTMRGILQTLRELYLYMFPLDAWFSYLLGALLVLGLFALRRQPRLAIGMLVLAFAPPALVLLVSLLKPMFLTRIMLYAPVPCYALMAAGAFAVPLRPLPYVLAAAIMFGGHTALDKYYYGYTPKSPFRRIIRYLHEQYDPKTLIVTSGSQERTVLKYYWNRRSDPLPTFPVGGLHGRKGNRVLKQVRGYDTLWIVDYKKGVRYSTRIARRELDKRARLVEQKQFGKVMLFRYDVRPQPKPSRPPRTKTAPWPGPLPDPATVPWPGPVPDPRGSRR